MCGIVAYLGKRAAAPVLVKGLKRLEYRGYDSAGVGLIESKGGDQNLVITKKKGKVMNPEKALGSRMHEKRGPNLGIAHTRWATHGEPSDRNSHPHPNGDNTVAVVHNGIIENYETLKKVLIKKGKVFKSETDTEVLAHLIDEVLKSKVAQVKSLAHAVSVALTQVEGTFGIAVVSTLFPGVLVGARRGSPLLLGVGEGEYLLASDAAAIVEYTDKVVYLKDEDIVEIRHGKHEISSMLAPSRTGSPPRRRGRTGSLHVRHASIKQVEIDRTAIEKGGHKFFMIKEILDQPRTLANCQRGRLDPVAKTVSLERTLPAPVLERLVKAERIIMCACGTSWHAALVGEYLVETLARLPVDVEYASEFRYKRPILYADTDVVLLVSQSGETADTLAALREAKQQGVFTMGVVNTVGSTIARECDTVLYIHAGHEMGVASTKAFTGQVMSLSMLALAMGQARGHLDEAAVATHVDALGAIPGQISAMLSDGAKMPQGIARAARIFHYAQNFLYLGRGFNFPVALEGALKLKEISYIHAEGYPAAEMKHGPIALIDVFMPVVFICPRSDATYEKIKSNIEEVLARKGNVLVITDEGNTDFDGKVEFVFFIPTTLECFTPLLTVVPLQLLSYHVADMRQLDVDRPRNLAKSVTVE